MIRFGVAACAVLLLSASLGHAQAPNERLPGPPAPVPVDGVAAASAGAGLGSGVYSTATVGQFIPMCGNDSGGCANEVGAALIDKMALDGSAGMCLPGPDYAPGTLAYLKAHPEMNSLPTEDGIYQALLKLYAC